MNLDYINFDFATVFKHIKKILKFELKAIKFD